LSGTFVRAFPYPAAALAVRHLAVPSLSIAVPFEIFGKFVAAGSGVEANE
jgi:hypothetical protein